MRLIYLCLFISFSLQAQHSEQPMKEDTTDLRSQDVMFSIEDVRKEKTFWLERSSNMDYFLRMKNGSKEQIRKVSSKDAKAMDMDFASRFLRCQYELVAVPGECNLTHRLSMKGEGQEICAKDEKKAQEMKPFLDNLSQRF